MGSRTQVALFFAALIVVCPSSMAFAQSTPLAASSGASGGAGSDDTLRSILTEQGPFQERLRISLGYTTEARPAPQERISSVFVLAIPEATYFFGAPGAAMSLTYAMTGSVQSLGGASEVANRLTYVSAFDLSRRTTMLVTGSLAHSSVSNFLLTGGAAAQTQPALFLGGNARFVTAGVSQSLGHELTNRIRVGQSFSVAGSTTLDPAPPADSISFTTGLSADHSWQRDALGLFTLGSYTIAQFLPPVPDQRFFTVSGGPSWRHDWSREVTSSVNVGVAVAGSPDQGTKPVVGEYASATVGYAFTDVTSLGISYSAGFTPAFLTNSLTRSHSGRISYITPISLHYRVFMTTGAGVVRASLIDLRNPSNTQDFTAGAADIDVTWAFSEFMQFFGRYQYIVQIGDSNNTAPPPPVGGVLNAGLAPDFMRDTIFFGVQFATRSPGQVQARFAERVDGADGRNASGRPANAGFSDRDEAERRERELEEQRRNNGFEVIPGSSSDPNNRNRQQQQQQRQPQMFETDQTRWRYTTPAQEPREENNQPVIR